MARILGLSVDDDAVRGALLKTHFKGVDLERVLEVRFADLAREPREAEGVLSPEHDDATIGPEKTDAQRRTEHAIRLLARRIGQPPDRVVADVPGTSASMRVLNIPAGAVRRLEEILPYELEAVLPFAPEEAVIDHELLTQASGEASVLACAVPKHAVASTLLPLHEAQVYPRELAAGAAALSGLADFDPELQEREGPTLLMDLSRAACDLCLLANNRPVYVRSLSVGSSAPERLQTELLRSLSGVRAQRGLAPSSVVLVGTDGEREDIRAWLEETLGIPVAPLPLPPIPNSVPAEPTARFGRAVALAARSRSRERRINLLQGEFAPRHALDGFRRHLPRLLAATGILLVAMLLAVVSEFILLHNTKQRYVEQLEAATEATFGVPVSTAKDARMLLSAGMGGGDPLPPFDAYDLIDILTTVVPKEITHDVQRLSFTMEEDGRGARFELKGTIPGIRELDGLTEELRQHRCTFCGGGGALCFQEVENKGSTAGRGGVGQNYRLEGTMRCPEDIVERNDRRSRRRRNP